MSKIVVLFNVKEGVDLEVYENWARTTDLPTVKNLASIDNFDVLRMTLYWVQIRRLPINILKF